MIFKNSLKILQWNCRSIRRKFDLLYHVADYDILVIIETWLPHDVHFHLPGFKIVRFDRIHGEGGGIAIFVKDKISFDKIDINLNINQGALEYGAISIKTERNELAIIALYRPPYNGKTLSTLEWQILIREVKKYEYFLLVGDINAHHQFWGSTKSCRNGRVIFDLYDADDIHILNDGSPTHISGPNNYSESNIDLSFASPSLSIYCNWRVGDDAWGSDHLPITIDVNTHVSLEEKQDYRYNINKLDWTVLYEELDKCKKDFSDINFLNMCVKDRYILFVHKLTKAIENSLPDMYKPKDNPNDNSIYKKKLKRPSCIWWNEECSKAVRIRRAKFKSLRYKMTREQFLEMKKIDARTKAILKESKRNSFRNFCESLNSRSNISNVWTKIKLFKNSGSRPLSFDGNKGMIGSMAECIENLCPPKVAVNHRHNINNLKESEISHELESLFTYDELEISICKANLKSAPGFDRINYLIINKLPEYHKRILLDIYNDLFYTCKFPDQWQKYLVLFIPKGSGNKVRPISLASCLLKLMERMICERLTWWVEKNNILAKTQSGFRKGKSCMDNLSVLTSEIHNSFYRNKKIAALLLDVKGAYDNVIPELLIVDLIDVGLPRKIVMFIQNLVSERSLIFVNYPGNITKKTYKGLPQGSVMSPLLYALYTRKISLIVDPRVKILEFADDIVVYMEIDNEEDIRIMEIETHKISNLLKDKNLALAPEKCKFIVFRNSTRKKIDYTFNMNNINITQEENVKFLGMHLDKRMNWDCHIMQTTLKCQKSLNILSCLRGTWWGSDPNTLLLIYKALIRSRIEYGGYLISPCSKNNFSKLEKIQNNAIRLCMGYRKSTPVNVMLAESKEISLEFRFEFLAYKYLLKCLSINNNKTINILENTKELLDNPLIINNRNKSTLLNCYENIWFFRDTIITSDICYRFSMEYNNSLTKPNIDLINGLSIAASISPTIEFNNCFSRDEDADKTLYLYTDGSKLQENGRDHVGFAVYSTDVSLNCKYKINDNASIFTAECLALKKALILISTHHHNKFNIFSDSKSALEALNHLGCNKNESPLITYIRELSAHVKNLNKQVTFTWIPAHVGIKGNEIADLEAKLAAKNGTYLQENIPVTDLFSKFRSKCIKSHQNKIEELGKKKGIFYYENFYNKKTRPWFHKHNISRKAIVSINRLRSNHSSLNNSLVKINVVPSDLCECGKSPDTPDHIFWCCEKHVEERKIMEKGLHANNVFGPYSAIPLLASNQKIVIKIIARFIDSIDKRL